MTGRETLTAILGHLDVAALKLRCLSNGTQNGAGGHCEAEALSHCPSLREALQEVAIAAQQLQDFVRGLA